MPLLVNSVPNLVQGVSQQPDSLRHAGQCEEQVNAWSTVVEGLVKRPNTNFVSKVSTSEGSGLFTHFVKRDEQNKYCVTVSLGGVGVIDLDSGNHIPVAVTATANSYLSLGSSVTTPLQDLRALTVADYTFLVNRKRVVQKASDAYSKVPEEKALIVVKLGDYEKNYTVFINDEQVTHRSVANLKYDHNPELDDPVEGTYESGPAQSGKGWHADTNIIAHDIALILEDHLTNTGQIGSVTITHGGNGWLDGGDTGTSSGEVNESYTDKAGGFIPIIKIRKVTRTYERTLELEVTQASTNASKALILLQVEGGVIVSAEIKNPGSSFDSNTVANPLTLTYIPKERIKKDGSWRDWETKNITDNPEFFGSSQNITVGGIQSSTTDFTVDRDGSVIQITNTAGNAFDVRVEDGLGNQGLGVVHKEVGSITDLPVECYNNFIVKVGGDPEINQDDYYVKFLTKNRRDNFGEGRWIETVGWYSDDSGSGVNEPVETLLADGSMPVTLIPFFNSSGISSFRLQTPNEPLVIRKGFLNYFILKKTHTSQASNEPLSGADWREYWQVASTFSEALQGALNWESGIHYYGALDGDKGVGWAGRQAGDDNTNPFPSFVGRTINDVFFFKNRLGILTDSHVIFSEADEYYNFFRTTTQQLLDSAPIDVGLSHTKVARLQYAKAFQEKLMLFADSSQFVLRGADVLSPKTVSISPVSEYDTTDNVEPLVLGNYIYFPFNRDKYVGMYEYYVDNNTEVFEAQEITEHVPKYIPSTIRMMAGSTTQNVVLVQSQSSPDQSSLFVYKYFWSGKEKIQSAWQKFTFGGIIRGFDFVDSTLYLFVNRNGGLYLEKLTLEEGYVDKREGLGEYFAWDADYPILLDCNTSYFEGITHQYDAVNNVTTLSNIPFNVDVSTIEIWSKYGRKYDLTGANPIATIVNNSTINIEGPLYDYVTYNSTIYKCNFSHDSGRRDRGADLAYLYKPDGAFGSVIWSTLTGDEATRVTTAAEWREDVWYEGYENFVIGYSYNMLYKFSDQTLKQPTEKGGRSASNYTYQTLRTGSLNYGDTGFFQVQVKPKHRDTYNYPFNSNLLGEGSLVNKFTPQDGHFRFPIQAQPGQVEIEITSNSALPVKLLGAEFESMMIPRSRRYGA